MLNSLIACIAIGAGLSLGYLVNVKQHNLQSRQERRQLATIFASLALATTFCLNLAALAAQSLSH
jgi:hypothetical protein